MSDADNNRGVSFTTTEYVTYSERIAQVAKGKTKGKDAPDPYAAEFARRVGEAFKAFNARRPRGDEMSQEELGRRVANGIGQKEPFSQAAVSRWMSLTRPNVPANPIIRALAAALETDAAWLAWGGHARSD
jgi:hypothetical protein